MKKPKHKNKVKIAITKDIKNQVGTIIFDKDKIPENLMTNIHNAHIQPTFKILEMEEKDGIRIITKVKLIEVNLVFDKKGGKNG